jgi:hypothetical protein
VGSASNYWANVILDLVFGPSTRGVSGAPASIAVPATVYVALFTDDADDAGGGTEVNTGWGYSRVAVPNDATHWPNAASGYKSNGVVVQFPEATGDWGEVISFAIYDDPTAGHSMVFGELNTTKFVYAGQSPRFDPGTLLVFLD